MEVNVGDSVEAVDQLGIRSKARVVSVSKTDNSIVVNFPPWRAEWDREISDPSEIRELTAEETLIPRRFARKKYPNLKKLFQGDVVYVDGKEAKVFRSDPIRKSVTVQFEDQEERCVNIWEVEEARSLEDITAPKPRKRQRTQKYDTGLENEDTDKPSPKAQQASEQL